MLAGGGGYKTRKNLRRNHAVRGKSVIGNVGKKNVPVPGKSRKGTTSMEKRIPIQIIEKSPVCEKHKAASAAFRAKPGRPEGWSRVGRESGIRWPMRK